MKSNAKTKYNILQIICSAVALGLVPVSAAAQEGRQPPLGNFTLSNSQQPIKINADNLEMLDKEGKATLTGNVSVKQGDALLRCGKLIVFYNKNKKREEAEPSGKIGRLSSSGIDHIEATGKVYLKSATQVAVGDSASYDAKSQFMILRGQRVILTDGENVATGCKLTNRINTGEAVLESCKSQRKERISIILARQKQQQPKRAPRSN